MKPDRFAADWLKDENNYGYGFQPIPSERDEQISNLLRAWQQLDASARRPAIAPISKGNLSTLLCYSERMACLAVRTFQQEYLLLGLLANGLDNWQTDFRENVIILALHYDAAGQIGVPPAGVFNAAAHLLPEQSSRGLRAFLRRSDDDRSLKAMGYEAGRDNEGFRYRRIW